MYTDVYQTYFHQHMNGKSSLKGKGRRCLGVIQTGRVDCRRYELRQVLRAWRSTSRSKCYSRHVQNSAAFIFHFSICHNTVEVYNLSLFNLTWAKFQHASFSLQQSFIRHTFGPNAVFKAIKINPFRFTDTQDDKQEFLFL